MPSTAQMTTTSGAGEQLPVLGADFQFALPPTRVIEGVVRDAKTGKALAGVGVESWRFAKGRRDGDRSIHTVSDAQGRFRLVGMPKGAGNRIVAIPNDEQPYLMRTADVPDEPGLEPAKVEFQLHRGIWITGRVTDRVTGGPVPGAELHYLPFRSNEYARALPEFPSDGIGYVDGKHYENRYQTAADGSYRLVGLPGPAIVGLSDGSDSHWSGQGASDIQGEKDPQGNFATFRNPNLPNDHYWPTVLKGINPAPGTDLADVNFALEPGGEVEIAMLDPAGQPIADVNVQGKTPHGGTPPVGTSKFAATGFRPTEERTILLRHWKRGLGKAILVRPEDQGKQITVRLEPFAKITGRLLDQDQKPITGRNIVFYTRPRMGIPLANEITDAQGRFEMKIATGLSFTAMVQGISGNPTIINEMSAEPGETIDLGTIDPASDNRPEPVRTKAAVAAAAPYAAPERPTTVSGQIILPDGKPAAGAHVAAIAKRIQLGRAGDRLPQSEVLAEGTADDHGNYHLSFKNVDPKTHPYANLIARSEGYAIAWQRFSLDGTSLEASLTLTAEEPVRGRLVGIEGQPAAGVRLVVQSVSAKSAAAMPDQARIWYQGGDQAIPKAWFARSLPTRPAVFNWAVFLPGGAWSLPLVAANHSRHRKSLWTPPIGLRPNARCPAREWS